MSNILKGLNEGRSYGRDSWDSNMPGYQGDYGGAANWGRRNREDDEHHEIDAVLAARHAQRQEYERNGKFWLKLKDSQRHLPAGPFTGKQAANIAAVELLKQQPELKGNLLITAYGPDEKQGVAEGSKEQEYGPEWDEKIKRLGQMAKQGERKTVWDPVKRVYKTVPIQQSSTKEGLDDLDENLHQWFKEKWVRFGPDGKIRGDCARGDDSEGKPKCLPQSKAQNLGKKGRASAAARKRREDPNPERSGKAINVNTKKKTNEGEVEGSSTIWEVSYDYGPHMSKTVTVKASSEDEARVKVEKAAEKKGLSIMINSVEQGVAEEQLDELSCWSGYHRVAGTKAGFPGSCAKNKTNEEHEHHSETCPHCGGEMVSEELMNEKKDACYYKVKSRYKVWPSAYASGALVKCRKSGADSWGNGGKSNESIEEDQLDEKWTKKYKDSINCSNPKGFSQKAHCAGKQKNESAILEGLQQVDEINWKHAAAAGAMALGALGGAGQAHAQFNPSGLSDVYLQQVVSGQASRPMVSVDAAKAELQARADGKQQKVSTPSLPDDNTPVTPRDYQTKEPLKKGSDGKWYNSNGEERDSLHGGPVTKQGTAMFRSLMPRQ